MSKIVIDVNSVVPYFVQGWTTGIGRTTMGLVAALDAMSETPMELALYSQNMKGIGAPSLGTHLTAHHLYYPYRNRYNQLLAHTPIREWKTGYDLYHIPHNFDYVRHPERTIITLHDCLYFTHPESTLNHQFARDNYPRLTRQCRAVITCSESSKRDILQYMDVPEEKVHVTPWGYDEQLFFPRQQQNHGRPFFLMVSCSEGRKNTMTLIKAYERFLSHGQPQHRLLLVWPHPSNEAEAYCSQPHLKDHVELLSHVSDQQLAQLYCDATVTFFPSRYEGFGFPVLESLASGTPVVAGNGSSLPEVGGTAALYVDPNDIDTMSAYMEQFENGGLTKKQFKEDCLQQASKFSWRRCAEQTIKIYQQSL